MIRRILAELVLIAVFLTAACASAEERRRTATGPVTVEVTNNNVLDVNVYAVAGSQTVRLGTVTSNSWQVFEVPPVLPLYGGLRFLVDPIGSRGTYLGDEVTVAPGDAIELVVQPSLGLSSTVVR